MRSRPFPLACQPFALLRSLQRAGLGKAALSASAPRVPCESWRQWLGSHVLLWPLGITAAPRWSVVSSRLPRALDAASDWFANLRAACFEAAVRGAALVCVEGTAGAAHVRHAARTLQLRSIDVRLVRGKTALVDASEALTREVLQHLASLPPTATPLWLIPASEAASNPLETVDPDAPLCDRAVVALGDLVRPLAVRRGGVMERLLAARRAERRAEAASVGDPADDPPAGRLPASQASRRAVRKGPNPALQLPWPALLHCTRRCDGPWPGQTYDEYQDELLWDLATRDRSPLATLRRIVAESRLRASTQAIRGGYAMVCFTSQPLDQLARLRRYRRHRRRWDFEPYGVAIRRDWLVAHGARPVIYADDEDWPAWPPDARPWFQPRGGRIEWQDEEEWRVRGDVDLSLLSEADAVLFVGSRQEARSLQAFSRWPVVWLDA